MSRERKRLAAEGFNLGCRCFQICALRLVITTLAPALVKANAIAWPMPRPTAGDHGYFSF